MLSTAGAGRLLPAGVALAVSLTALAGCGGAANPPGGPTQAATRSCTPKPCAAGRDVIVSVNNLNQWYQFTETMGPLGGPKFVWHIKNATSDTLSLDDRAISAFDAQHAEISNTADSADAQATNGCPQRLPVRIPPHQSITSPGPICLGVTPGTKAAVLEFSVGSSVLDVTLPASYGTQSDPCPPDHDLATAIAPGLESSVQISNRFCKGDYAVITVTATPFGKTGLRIIARDDPPDRQSWFSITDSSPCANASKYPPIILQQLGC